MGHTYVDAIAHAWRYCNPHTPLPPALVRRAESSGLALGLYRSDGKLAAEWSGTAQDIRNGLLTVANLPLVSPPTGE
jgi:hypothetical protein